MNTVSVASTVLNGQRLHKIAHKSSSSVITMTALAMRERFRRETNIDKTRYELLKAGEKLVDADYLQTWKDLEEAGMGSIVHGRGANPTRFIWNYNLKDVAKAALEGKTEESVEKFEEPKRKPGRPPREIASENKKPPATKKIIFPLRKNFDLELVLPVDVTKEEVSDITNVLNVIIK